MDLPGKSFELYFLTESRSCQSNGDARVINSGNISGTS